MRDLHRGFSWAISNTFDLSYLSQALNEDIAAKAQGSDVPGPKSQSRAESHKIVRFGARLATKESPSNRYCVRFKLGLSFLGSLKAERLKGTLGCYFPQFSRRNYICKMSNVMHRSLIKKRDLSLKQQIQLHKLQRTILELYHNLLARGDIGDDDSLDLGLEKKCPEWMVVESKRGDWDTKCWG